jgi:hypothetical protein
MEAYSALADYVLPNQTASAMVTARQDPCVILRLGYVAIPKLGNVRDASVTGTARWEPFVIPTLDNASSAKTLRTTHP